MCAWSAMHADTADAANAADIQRRALVRGGAIAALAAWGCAASAAANAEETAFAANSLQEALSALGGIPALGTQIVLDVPEAAENGALVPVAVTSNLPHSQEIFIVVESNPNPLVVRFTIPPGTEPFIATRIKMAESGNVYALVRADGRLYAACRRTDVRVGGCG
jgi:sulfur-oxidizing protein SoxY